MFFTYTSASHDLVHRALHFPPLLNEFLLSALEAICLRSGHAFRLTHLQHHKRFPHDDDVEGAEAAKGFWNALACGPSHQIRLFFWGLAKRRFLRASLDVLGGDLLRDYSDGGGLLLAKLSNVASLCLTRHVWKLVLSTGHCLVAASRRRPHRLAADPWVQGSACALSFCSTYLSLGTSSISGRVLPSLERSGPASRALSTASWS